MKTLTSRKFSILEFEYTGGPLVFEATFALGIMTPEHIQVFVAGEVDGLGEQIYRPFAYDANTSTLTVLSAITAPAKVTLIRTMPKDSLYISFLGGADVTRTNIDSMLRYTMMALHEVLDGRWDFSFVDLMQSLVIQAQASADTALSAVVDALNSATTAAISAAEARASAEAALASQLAAAASAASIDLNALLTKAANPGLVSIGGLSVTANSMLYTTATNVYASATLTPFAMTLLDDTDAATMRTTLGVQRSNTNLTELAAITDVEGDLFYRGPTALIRLGKGAWGQILRQNDGLTAPFWDDPIKSTPAQDMNGLSSFDWVGIPEWANRITVMSKAISLSGSDLPLVQLGVAAGFATTGYLGSLGQIASGGNASRSASTAGFPVGNSTAGEAATTTLTLTKMIGLDTWMATVSGARSTNETYAGGGGSVTLAGPLTQIRLTRSGTNTFDAGSASITWE